MQYPHDYLYSCWSWFWTTLFLMAGSCSMKTVTCMWTVTRPGQKQRLFVTVIRGMVFRDTWHLFTQRRRILLWQVFQMKESGLVAMISRRKVIGLGLMALQLHTETGFQITQATMEAMNIAWSFTIHLRKNGTILIVPTSSSLCVNLQKVIILTMK